MTNDLLFNLQLGSGKPIICLHGWGMHSGIFVPLAQQLQERYLINLIDLPGHGYSDAVADLADLSAVVRVLKSTLDVTVSDRIILLATSMGGLIAQWFALQYPQQVEKLVLVSSTACFANKTDWGFGMQADLLAQFASQLETDHAATLDRFLALQFMGSEDQKAQLRRARELMAMKPAPQLASLRQGLTLLSETDLRADLANIHCPVLIVGGEYDKLVPTTAIRYLAEKLPYARAVIFKGCGHAPYLSHKQPFVEQLNRFIHE